MGSSRHGRRHSLVVAFALVAAIGSGIAIADVGDLGFRACIEDRVAGAAPEECATTEVAMNGARGIVESDRGVYLASFLDNALVRFERNPADGTLSSGYCFKDGAREGECRTRNAPGLAGANSAFVPSDLGTLLVTADSDNAVTSFDVHAPSGRIFRKGCIEDIESGEGDCGATTQGLDGASSAAAHLESAYVAASGDDALVRIERNPHSSEIRPQSCIEDSPRDGGCETHAPGLDGARSVAIARRGATVYVAGGTDDAVVTFPRDRTTGRLSKGSCIGDAGTNGCSSTAPGLDGAYTVASSWDGRSVYVTSEADDALVHFYRNSSTGLLEFRDCIEDSAIDSEDRECARTTPGLNGTRGLAVSYDGRSVYATSYLDEAILVFDRDPGTGALTPRGCIRHAPSADCAASAPGISRPNSIAVSIDDSSVYVAGYDDDAVAHFRRDEGSGRLTPAG